MHQISFGGRWGGAYSAPSDPLAALKLIAPLALDHRRLRRLASRLRRSETERSASSFFAFEHCLVQVWTVRKFTDGWQPCIGTALTSCLGSFYAYSARPATDFDKSGIKRRLRTTYPNKWGVNLPPELRGYAAPAYLLFTYLFAVPLKAFHKKPLPVSRLHQMTTIQWRVEFLAIL